MPCLLLSCVTCWGCGSSDDPDAAKPFQELHDVRVWATTVSAVAVYSRGYQLIAVADGQETYADPTCPSVSDDGTTLTVQGDCTDRAGHDWKGSATVERDGDDRAVKLAAFEGDAGDFTLHQVNPSLHEFEAHYVAGEVTTVDYSGSVHGDYGAETLWHGSGHAKREGVLLPNGEVDATTLDEIVDDSVCSGQPVSGSTTLTAGDQTAVITYDGDTDCDSDQNAQLSVNGEDRGLMDGITCAVRAPGAAGRGAQNATTLVGLALLLGRVRRRRSYPTTSIAGRQCGAPRPRSATCRCKA